MYVVSLEFLSYHLEFST